MNTCPNYPFCCRGYAGGCICESQGQPQAFSTMRDWTSMKIWVFVALLAGHWLEHLFQAWQVYVMHMPRHCALGLLGMRYPWLVRTESLHFGFAVLTTFGIASLWSTFSESRWWKAAYAISIWHLFEHTLLFFQAQLGVPQPTSVIQFLVPRIELHLFYNTLVTIPIIVAMVLYRSNVKNDL